MSDDNKSHIPKLIIAGVIGVLAGSWWKSAKIAESKKSRDERERSGFVNEVRSKINELLDELELLDEMENEDDFRDVLAEYLTKYTNFEIEVTPNTLIGQPDILIGGVLALEVKYNPNKSEMDRCIGQCAGYSREWVTWIILYDTPPSRINYISEVLSIKGWTIFQLFRFKKITCYL